MAGSLNKVMLIGNLGADPEISRSTATQNLVFRKTAPGHSDVVHIFIRLARFDFE